MRIIEDDLKKIDLDSNQVHYNYEITLINGKIILLTSRPNNNYLDNKNFYSYSGLRFVEGYFNDSAKDHIILEGIYDELGITKNTEITGAKVQIWRELMPEKHYHFVTFYCTIFTKYDLDFQIYLEPESTKFNQSLLNCYSKTCRASFGDDKCKVDKDTYSFKYNIKEINGRNIMLSAIEQENGYFSGGEAIIGNGLFKARIITHFRSSIEINKSISEEIKNYHDIVLIAGCDKKFITCCNKFNNAVNFRGEPFIPKHDFLKIN